MSIEIKFGRCNDDNNVLNKTIIWDKTYSSCNMLDAEDCITPVVRISDTDEDLSNINYMYIAKFNRYYFVKPKVIRTNLWEFETINPDVLESFKNDIKQLDVIVERQEKECNLYIPDSQIMMQNKRNTITKAFPNSLDSKNQFSIFLITSGGGEVAASTTSINE